MAFIWHNCAKVWVYAVRTSWVGRFIWQKSKHKNLIRRMSCTFALIADLALIKWSLKEENNLKMEIESKVAELEKEEYNLI